ncbi:2-oxoacid:acceptor oxidoreductase family protein [Candidatus Kuenenbacteria bacterium]|nr:2-oxoacid:acceptor oxidoreductase family protein [Candidatus Kuenenbacteria bacterium]
MSTFKICIYGRGGQGAKSAAQFIVEAALMEKKFIQAFPEYGPERFGAPVVAYVRISDQEILTHEPILRPKAVLVLDEDLIEIIDVAKGLEKNGVLIINSSKKRNPLNPSPFFGKKVRGKSSDVSSEDLNARSVYFLDASKIALEFIKKDKPNTAMLGALVKITQIIKLENLIKVIKKHFLAKLGEKEAMANVMAMREGNKYNF